MIGTPLHWVEGPWKGRLALAARPRGDDWLEDELLAWKASGVHTVVSLLEPSEEAELGLAAERDRARHLGLDFLSFPIPDRAVPSSAAKFDKILGTIDRTLAAGRSVVVHCRQGIGRTGLVAACLMINTGSEPRKAIELLSNARGIDVPETPQQRTWIERFAGTLALTQ